MLAFFRESIAALNIALFEDFRHFCNRVMFYFTIMATMVLSSTISFGLNNRSDWVLGVLTLDAAFDDDLSSRLTWDEKALDL